MPEYCKTDCCAINLNQFRSAILNYSKKRHFTRAYLQFLNVYHGITVTFLLSKLDLDYSYSELSDIVQLDGPAGNSDMEEEEGVPLEENDFLGMINAEAIKALQEGNGSSDGDSISSSDSDAADELANVEEEVRGSVLDINCWPLAHLWVENSS